MVWPSRVPIMVARSSDHDTSGHRFAVADHRCQCSAQGSARPSVAEHEQRRLERTRLHLLLHQQHQPVDLLPHIGRFRPHEDPVVLMALKPAVQSRTRDVVRYSPTLKAPTYRLPL